VQLGGKVAAKVTSKGPERQSVSSRHTGQTTARPAVRVRRHPVRPRVTSPERRVANMFRRWYRGLIGYFRETRLEMRKVAWPSRRETVIYTLVVVLATVVVGVIVWVFDVGLSAALGLIIK